MHHCEANSEYHNEAEIPMQLAMRSQALLVKEGVKLKQPTEARDNHTYKLKIAQS